MSRGVISAMPASHRLDIEGATGLAIGTADLRPGIEAGPMVTGRRTGVDRRTAALGELEMASRRSLDVPTLREGEFDQGAQSLVASRQFMRVRHGGLPWNHWACLTPARSAHAMPETAPPPGHAWSPVRLARPAPEVVGTRRGAPAGPSSMREDRPRWQEHPCPGHARRLGPRTRRAMPVGSTSHSTKPDGH